MNDVLTPDICVIGGGSGGLSVAAAAGAMQVPVVLIEKGLMGGDCLNYGCVPSKALIAAGAAAQTIREAARFGVSAPEPQIDMAAVRAHVRGVVDAIAPADSAERFAAMGVRVIQGAGRFISPREVEAGGMRIRARRFVIATGSAPAIPPIPGLEQVRSLTNETIFDLDVLPTHLAIVGGGPIGLELAQAFRRLGSKVTVIEGARALSREDPELSAPVVRRLREEGVIIHENARLARVDAQDAGARLSVSREGGDLTIDASHLLIAAGRSPNVHNLGLEQAGVNFSRAGITVGKDLRTSNRRIYAIGDVAGGGFTHAANYHAGLVIRAALFRMPVKAQPHLIPRVTFTDPEIAVAGLTEAQARETHKLIHIYRWPFGENDRARAERDTVGHIKIVADAKERILGVGIVGADAGEHLALWQLALKQGLKVGDVAGLVMPYPVRSEVSKRAAVTQLLKGLGNPWLGRILRFLRRFG